MNQKEIRASGVNTEGVGSKTARGQSDECAVTFCSMITIKSGGKMADHFQVSSHGNALEETQQKHPHYRVLILLHSFIGATYDRLQS